MVESALKTQKSHKKIDRRVSRTRQALRQALYELIQEKGYDAVTIEEITERANLGRTTFYLHFRDKDDLLLDRFKEQLEEVFRQLSELSYDHWVNGLSMHWEAENTSVSTRQPILILFDHFAEYTGVYQELKRSGTLKIVGKLNEMICFQVVDLYHKITEKEQRTPDLQVPIEVLAAYFAGALLSTIMWWLNHNCPYTADQMARQFIRMFIPGARIAFGLAEETRPAA